MKDRFPCLIAIVGLVCVVSGFAASAAVKNQGSVPARPNFLLIISDDLNDWITPMKGHPEAKTPALETIAARGVTFMNAQSPAPLCNPSRTAFMSGKRPSTTGIYHNQQTWMKYIPRGLCINDYIRQHGFKSYGAGKIYHYRNYRADEWDEVFYVSDDTLPRSVADRCPGPHGYRMFTDGAPQGPYQEQRAESALVDAKSVSWCIDKLKTTNRFFMTCGIHRPHTPWDVPKKYFDLYPAGSVALPKLLTNDLSDVPPAGVAMANPTGMHPRVLQAGVWQDRVRAYLAAVSYMDAQVGRLIEALDNSAHRDNTIVVFVGDNGWHLGQKEHWGKTTLWANGASVPMIWAVPGMTRGSLCEHGVDLMCIYPTVCEFAGVPLPKHVEGISIKPLIENPAAKWAQPGISTMYKDNHTLVTADWRYIRYADGSEELYNRKADPLEWTNLAAKAELASVKKELAGFLPKVNADSVPSEDPAKKKKKKKGKAAAVRGE